MTLRHTFMPIIGRNADKYRRCYRNALDLNTLDGALEHVSFFHVLAPLRLLLNHVMWGLVTVNAVLVAFLLLLLSIFVS